MGTFNWPPKKDAIYVASSTERLALSGLKDGQLVVEIDTNQVYSWDDGTTSWVKIGGSLSPSEVNDTNTVDHTVTGGVLTSDVQYQDTNTSAISDDASGLKVDVQYQDSDTVNLSDDASGLKAEVIWPDYSNIYFVGKHGNDANDGLSPEKAKLTFSSAISAASAGDCIFCYDAGVYAEDITCVDDVDIFAQNATLQLGNGTQDQITLADNTVTFKKITRTAGGNTAILLSNASGYARLNVELIEDSGTGITIRSTSTNMAVIIVDQFYVNGGGTAIADFTSGGQHIHLKVKDIYLNSNNAVAVSCTNSSEIYGEIQHISPIGGATGTTALDINAGTVSIYSHSIEAATAYDVEAGATLNILTQEIIGTELNDGTVIGREANTLIGEVTFDTFPITPSDAPDADYEVANKKYVDDRIDGFKPKAAVRAASTANVNISNELESGDSLDGVTLTTGDRILLKDQTDASENGIYIVPASGSAARSTDFDETTPVDEINGAWVAVQEGTENEGSIYIQYGTVTAVGTDDIDFTLKASISDLVAGDGIDISGSTVSSDVDDSTIGINGSSKLEIKDSSITNSKVAAGAAIEESKLNLDNSTADAIHDNVSGEINAITEKTEPVDEDLLLIEDSEASYAKKKLQLANLATAGGSEPEIAFLKDVKSATTLGGTFTSGSWQTRTLNTLENSQSWISQVTGGGETTGTDGNATQFTLTAGKYRIRAAVPGYAVQFHKAKLYNITDTSDEIIGTAHFSTSETVDAEDKSEIVGVFTISSTKTFEIQHRCSSTKSSNGFGRAAGFSTIEVYTQVEIERLGDT